MRCFVTIVFLTSWVTAQNGRGPQHQDHNGHGWDIRLAVPGKPGNDYPTLNTIPRTSFSCAGIAPGYYADRETNCQVFRVCTVGSTYGFQSFLCPNGTLFNQEVSVCDWWMNVSCEKSEQLLRNNNEQFENLRLGPQLMKDIKKMLTYPMRNPYDKKVMKNNLIVMQDYKPPVGQLFPNGALIAGPERAPSNVYMPKQNLIQNSYTYSYSDNSVYASTPGNKYVPSASTTSPPTTYSNTKVFQRQNQYDQSNKLLQNTKNLSPANIISNEHTGQLMQHKNIQYNNNNGNPQRRNPKQNNNQRNSQHTLNQTNNPGATQTGNTHIQKSQLNRQRDINTKYRKAPQSNRGKLTDYIVSTSKQSKNYTPIQDKLQLSNKTASTYSNELPEGNQNEVKQNVALVFSLLADSINAAKEYSNIAQQEALSPTPAPQFQNVNNENIAQITNQISQLTSSQYAGSGFNKNINANIISTVQTSSTAPANQQETNNEQHQAPNTQASQYNLPLPQLQGPVFSSQFQSGIDVSANLLANYKNNQIYSGQLYQFPVTDVTNHIYNKPFSENLVQSSNIPQLNAQTSNTLQSSEQPFRTDFEIVQSQTLPFNPSQLLLRSSNERESFSQENLSSLLKSNNGLSGQDNIIGTIPHPQEDNKLVTYEKNQSYYFTSNLHNNAPHTNIKNSFTQTSAAGTTQNVNIPQSDGNVLTLQFIPSFGYQLEDEKQQQQLLDAFQIDEFGAPRDVKSNLIQSNNRGQNILTNSVNYSAEHTFATQLDGSNINSLYTGPSSYLAPQSSLGSLSARQENVPNNLYSRFEEFDEANLDNTNDYSKIRPSRQFVF